MTESQAKFIYTGPGRYPQRDGGVATVSSRIDGVHGDYPLCGFTALDHEASWTMGGFVHRHRQHPADLIGPRIADTPEPVKPSPDIDVVQLSPIMSRAVSVLMEMEGTGHDGDVPVYVIVKRKAPT